MKMSLDLASAASTHHGATRDPPCARLSFLCGPYVGEMAAASLLLSCTGASHQRSM